jgi:CRISPR-associated endonuclease Csn1
MSGKTILGLDLGAASVGWALIRFDRPASTGEIIATGSRIFPSGVDGDLASGREESRNVQRRQKRQMRRQGWRRKRRIWKTYKVLQTAGLLPPGGDKDSHDRHQCLIDLDQHLRSDLYPALDRREAHLLPYLLRRDALDREMPEHAVGRAILHLAMRRGFQSNRRAPIREDEEAGIVKSSIEDLDAEMAAAGSRTIGEYFSTLDPEQQRIRNRYLGRKQIHQELEQIWNAQAGFHSSMSDDVWKDVFHAVLDQRPLKSQKGLVARCDLEVDQRRIARAHRLFQRFRMLQKVNDLQIVDKETGEIVSPDAEQREALLEQLSKGDLTWAKAKKALGVKARGTRLNLEDTGDKKLIGDRNAETLIPLFGDRWHHFSDDQKDQLVEDLLTIEDPAGLKRRGIGHWGLDEETATLLGDTALEDGRGSLSRRAIEQMLPRLEEGVAYATVRKECYPTLLDAGHPVDRLPPVKEAFGLLRNPAVERTLTELRKVVNAVVREHGKPDLIRIELARDLRKPRTVRQKIQKNQRDREKKRAEVKDRLLAENLVHSPKRSDIEKVLLADECNWQCPYTGQSFGWNDLFGAHPSIDVEHIIPYSRSQDNSFLNKTLCLRRENANKSNRTPFEAYSGDPDRYDPILDRVARFQGDGRLRKLHRFKMEELPADFAARDLVDTAYASRLAMEYTGLLFGGEVDASHKRRVQASGGRTTSILRWQWGLNGVLGGDGKNRSDHRHHALDAIVIACTGPGVIQEISRAAERAVKDGSPRLMSALPLPWSRFKMEVEEILDQVIVSHRPRRRVRGALHEETIYGKARPVPGSAESVHRVRKAVAALSRRDIPKIIDPVIRHAVQQAFDAIGDEKPEKAFANKDRLPRLPRHEQPDVVVRRVRLTHPGHPVAIGKGDHSRNVQPGRNHHLVVVAVLDPETEEITEWEEHLVTLLEASRRKGSKEPIFQTDWGPDRRFLFSICVGDILEQDLDGERVLVKVNSISKNEYERSQIQDARTDKEKRTEKSGRIRGGIANLKKVGTVKKSVQVLGVVRDSHD